MFTDDSLLETGHEYEEKRIKKALKKVIPDDDEGIPLGEAIVRGTLEINKDAGPSDA